MSRQQVITSLILGLLCLAAIIFTVFSILLNGNLSAGLVGAVALLALAQLVSYLSRVMEKREDHSRESDLMVASDRLGRDVSMLRQRMDRIESTISSVVMASQDRPDGHVSALRTTAHRMRDASAAPAAARPDRAEPVLGTNMSAPQALLHLEPVVRIDDMRTAYYRASLGGPRDRVARGLSGTAERADLAIFDQSAPVIRQFQQRGRSVGLFCPVESRELADENFISRLIEFVEANRDIAGSLVLDLTQSALASLDEEGQRGLAYLAQLGATFCLSGCQLNVPDLTALKSLGFAFVDADVRVIIAAKRDLAGPGSVMINEARRIGLSLIASGVDQDSDLSWVQDDIELARGRRFSPPRPVRHDITSAAQQATAA